MPNLNAPGVAIARTGRDLALALARNNINFILMLNNIIMTADDWVGLNAPVQRTTRVTISGQPGASTSWPKLDLGFVKGQVGQPEGPVRST